MQRSTPIRSSHSSTSDLLTWPELPPPESSAAASGHRARQPSDKIGEVLRGSQLTEEESQSLTKKKPCSGYKMKEMTGSGIFSASAEDTTPEVNEANSKNRTGIRVYKQAMNNGISQIFNSEESISPKKPTSLPKAAKQRELSGTLQSEPNTESSLIPISRRQISSAKTKELSGNDIFGPAPEIVPRSLPRARALESRESNDTGEIRRIHNLAGGQSNVLFREGTAKKTSRKLHDQKSVELTGNNIFREDVPAVSAEKYLSIAKLREMSGSDIFGDGKEENLRGSRRAPRGGSSIAFA